MDEKSIQYCAIDQKLSTRIAGNISETLQFIAQSFNKEKVNWVVISSCALALHELDVEPSDIDIMTDDYGMLQINRILNNYKMPISEYTSSQIFESTLNKFFINNCLVEVMSNFKIKSLTENRWYDMSNLLQCHHTINYAGLIIPILSLSDLLVMYKVMNRNKDISKIKKIEHQLKIQNF